MTRSVSSFDEVAAEFVGAPPGRGRARGAWPKRLQLLRDHPGEWARWKESGTTKSGGHLNREADRGAFGPGKWEFTNRTINGQSYLYARYAGEVETP